MSYLLNENGLDTQVWDSTSEFTQEERELINKAGLTVPELRAFYEKYPEQTLEAAVGGLLNLKASEKAEEVPEVVIAETQEDVPAEGLTTSAATTE